MNNQEVLMHRMAEYAQSDLVVAFSGGVDSSLLLRLACEAAARTGTRVYAVTAQTKLHPCGDLEIARTVAKQMGAIHCVVEMDELAEAEIENNPKDRCYRCKKSIFQKILDLAQERGASTVIEGTNEDDLHQYRPGIQALHELHIHSPLAECGLTKLQIRALAEQLGISVANRPSSPCLATRLPYGDHLDYGILEKIDQGEQYLRELGYYNVRLRVHGTIARLEVDQEELNQLLLQRTDIISQLKGLGFTYITMDLEGFRSGSMDL